MATKKTTKTAKTKTSQTKKTSTKVQAERVTVTKTTVKSDVSKKLNGWNWILALIYAVQGAAILYYGESAFRSLTTSYLAKDPLAGTSDSPVYVQAVRVLFDVNIQYFVAAVLVVAALSHVFSATVGRKKYEKELSARMNSARWLEYAVGGGLLVGIVGLLSGVSDIATLAVVAGLTALMYGMSGHMMERTASAGQKTNWLKYGIGVGAGLVAWAVVKVSLFDAVRYGDGLPVKTYWLVASMFGLFVVQGVVQYLFYRRKAFAKDYMNYEWAHMVLGLVLKSAFAWQIFAAFLR